MTNNDDIGLEIDEFDLESLIVDGVEAKIPIVIEFPRNGQTVKASAMIRPLTNYEWNNATRLSRAGETTTNEVELVKQALYTKDGKEFPEELVEKIPAGVIVELVKEIAKVSGINLTSKENLEMARQMMGFSR